MIDVQDEELDTVYYDLLECEISDGSVLHIPIPILIREVGLITTVRVAGSCSSSRTRTGSFFTCPGCRLTSFFAGPCRYCQDEGDFDDPLWQRWAAREARKRARKRRIIGAIRRDGEVPSWVWDTRYVRSYRRNGMEPPPDPEAGPCTPAVRILIGDHVPENEARAVRAEADRMQTRLEGVEA